MPLLYRLTSVLFCVLLLSACDGEMDGDGGLPDAMTMVDAGPDSDSGTDDDAGTDSDAGTDPDAGDVMDGGVPDGGAVDGGDGGEPDAGPVGPVWPETPTTTTFTDGFPPSSIEEVQVVETSGGHAVALWRSQNAGRQYHSATYDGTAWSAPRLVPGRLAKIAVSGDRVLVTHMTCDNRFCERSLDLYAEVYTESGGWAAAQQLDVVSSGHPFESDIDSQVRDANVTGDGAGGFLVTWAINGPSSFFHREYRAGVWQEVIGEVGNPRGQELLITGHGPGRYAGIVSFSTSIRSISLVAGALVVGPTFGSPSFGVGPHVITGDHIAWAGTRGRVIEAMWDGSAYTFAEVPRPSPSTQVEGRLASDGTHVISVYVENVSSRNTVGAYIRRDVSGTGAGTMDWTEHEIAVSTELDAVPAGVHRTGDGAVVFYWQSHASDPNWDLMGRRLSFDSDDAVVLSPAVVLSTVMDPNRNLDRVPARSVAADAFFRLAYEADDGPQLVAFEVDGSAAGIVPGATSALPGTDRYVGDVSEVVFDGIEQLAFGDWSVMDARVDLVTAAGTRATALTSNVLADGTSDVHFLQHADSAALVWGRRFDPDRVLVVSMRGADTWSTPELVPSTSSDNCNAVAFGEGGLAIAQVIEAEDPAMRLLVRSPSGVWSTDRIAGPTGGDIRCEPNLVPFGSGFVVSWAEETEGPLTLRAARYDGGAWSLPETLATDIPSVGESGFSRLLSANETSVVAAWVDTDDLHAAVLSSLADGFGATAALRSDTTPTVERVEAASGPEGHLLAFVETATSGTTQLRAMAYTGSWGALETPMPSVTDLDGDYLPIVTPEGYGVGVGTETSAIVARRVGGSWSSSTPITGTMLRPYTIQLMSSAAGLRVVINHEDSSGETVYETRLHDGTTWGALGSFTKPDQRNLNGVGIMNDSGDMGFFLSPFNSAVPASQVGVLRADGTLERLDVDPRVHDAEPIVLPNGRFGVLSLAVAGPSGARRVHFASGY